MTSRILAASLIAAVVSVSAATAHAQSDRIHLLDGTVIKDVSVTEYDIRGLRYKKGRSTEIVACDRVAKLELGEFKTVYARGLRDPDLMLTLAREQQKAKNDVMAQLGFVGAARQFFDRDEASKGVAALNELEKAYPQGGALPEIYRQKFEYYIGLGPKGLSNAAIVAKKYESEAVGKAWPAGFAVEGKFYQVLCEQSDAATFQKQLRTVINRARSSNATVANRANIELAHSLRKTKQVEEAQRIYESVLEKEGADDSARGGAYLGLGLIALENSGSDKEMAREALLKFLRVRLETTDAWPHAEISFSSTWMIS